MSVVLSEHLPLLASAPNGIQKLRALILELAVRGKLAPQDAKDEPAEALLERIALEKARVSPGRGGKRQQSTPSATIENQPFVLPAGWVWTRLGEIALINPRNAADDSTVVSFVPMAMIGTRFEGTHEQELRTWAEVKQGFTHFAEGDVGVAKITPCFENSKACVFSGLSNGIGAGTTELHIVRPIAGTLAPRYVLAYLKAPIFLHVGESRMTGTAGQKRLPKDFLEQNSFPLPPLAEQHRIVAKVDELMALCDRLEAEQADAEAAHARLVDALLAALTRSTDAADFAANWQRLAAHFDTLFTTEAAIDALKQTILQLAVMGKLVPQDPNDEPASELLRKIESRKRMLAGDKIPRKKSQGYLPNQLQPIWGPPCGWAWSKLADLTEFVTDGEHATPQRTIDQSAVPLVTAKNVRDGFLDYTNTDFVPRNVAEKCWRRCKPELNDILIVSVGATLGRLAILNHHREMVIVRSVTLIRPCLVDVAYLALALRSPYVQKSIWGSVKQSAQPCLYLTQSSALNIPIPPAAEQHRIVAKVDELMALCDRLKADLATARQRQATLADTLVAAALEAA